MPLSLFTFRIKRHVNYIQFQLPKNISSFYESKKKVSKEDKKDKRYYSYNQESSQTSLQYKNAYPYYSKEIQNYFHEEISSLLKDKDNKMTNFSNLIDLLMDNTPNFFHKSNSSKLLREILINLMSMIPFNNQHGLIFFKKLIAMLVDTLGSSEWNDTIHEELFYDVNKSKIISLFANPWRFVAEEIREQLERSSQLKNHLYEIKILMYNLSNNESINIILQSVNEDKKYIENKINTNDKKQIEVVFGESSLDEFISRLQFWNKTLSRTLNDTYLLSYVSELEKFGNIKFSNDIGQTPMNTSSFLSDKIIQIVSLKKEFEEISPNNFKPEPYHYIRLNFYNDFSLNLKEIARPVNSVDIISDIKNDYHLITLIIFKYKNDFKVTIKEIEIDAGPFFYGIDIAPIQIRLDNLTNEEVLCDFDVTVNPTDEMPTYKNNKDFIIFEFPVQSLKSLNQTQLINEKTFYFKGSIWLKIKGNKNWSHQIKYSISVTYKSPIIFISIKNNHFFAINENKIEIVPFFSNLSSKLLFEKYIYNRSDDAKITFLDKIIPLEDNTIKTTYVSKQNKSDGQIIEVLFHKSQNPINNISIKYEFGIINDKCIPVEFHTSSFFKYQSFNFSIFSDTTKNFEKENVIINIGNLSRKVFFFVGNINYFEEPINSDDIHFSYNNNYVHFYFNKNENKYLVSSTYQYAIYFFDVIYEGPISQQDEFEGKLTLTISNITEIVDLKIKINFINFGKSGIECNGMLNEYYYYNNDSESMVKIENINENFAFKQMQNQILISPFCFSYYAKDDSVPKIQYKNGYISEIIYDPNTQIIFEVLGFSQSNALQIFTIDDPKELFNQGKNIYILARIKDRHETFFPIISTNIDNTYPFNSIMFRSSVKKAVSLIAQFTNNSEFIEYSNTSLKINFESFISALDKLISNRYYILKSLNFFISTNIPLSSIKNQQETVFNALFKKEDITKCEYVISYENNYQKSINAERENIEKYRKNGFIITSVLKWTETKGITSSTIDELNEYKNEIFNPKRDIKIVYDYELTDTELIEFPEKMTIDLIDQSFSKILYLTYFLPNIIYDITINRIPLNGVINILNQLISIYKWTYNHGDYFPFVIFKKKFKQAYFLMITKIIKSIETIIDLCLGELPDSNIEYVVLPKFRIKNLIIPQFSTRNRSILYKSKNLNEKINYIFNEKDLTCSVGKSPEASGSILIPYSVEHNKNQYRVTSIEKHAFYNCKIESIGFSPKSCITIFKEFAFENATIKKLTIPLGLKFIEKGCFNQVKCLFDIFIPSENHMFKYIDSKFFLGKSDKNMIKCDILHYVRFDVPEKSIKYFVKNIRYNYYYKIECKQPQINTNDNSIELPKFNRCTNSRLKIRTFVPIKNLFYCFFAELQQPNYHLLNIYYTHLFSIRNASDIQRFHFYPGTRNIYTFIGFSDENTMNNNIDKLEKKSIAIDNAIYKYPYVKKADPLFSPDENLFYVYFKEKNLEVKNYRKCGKSKIFEIENIKDLQRGFKVQQKDFEYYTFIGFSNKNELKTSIQILQKQSQLIEVPTIRIFEGDDVLHDYDYDYDYDDDDEEVDVFKNLENETGKKKEDLNNNDHEQSFINTNNATKKESSEEDFDYDDNDY